MRQRSRLRPTTVISMSVQLTKLTSTEATANRKATLNVANCRHSWKRNRQTWCLRSGN